MGAVKAIFDELVDGNAGNALAFTRNYALTEKSGNELVSYAADEMRFGERRLVVGQPDWSVLFDAGGDNAQILASGFKHDNVTPIVVIYDPTLAQFKVYEWTGSAFTLLSTTANTDWATKLSAGVGVTYTCDAADIHHGLIVVTLSRSVSGVAKGITGAYSQDNGNTWSYVGEYGASNDWSVIAGDVSSGMDHVRDWGGPQAFPVGGINNIRDAFFLTADYIVKTSLPKGGQVFGFRATRETDTGTWTVQSARKLYERWEPADPGAGFHIHGAGLFYNDAGDSAVVVSLGDVAYRNNFSLVEFDLDSYQTDTLTTTNDWHGEYTGVSTTWVNSPQPVSLVPHPDGGVLASADLTQDIVLKLEKVTSASDRCRISCPLKTTSDRSGGVVWVGFDPLWLTFLQGVGYVSGFGNELAGIGAAGWVSFDGDTWGVVPGSRAYRFQHWLGSTSRLIGIDATGNLCISTPIRYRAITPAKINPGAINKLRTGKLSDVGANLAPVAGTVKEVTYSGGEYRYVSDNSLVPGAPSFPPPLGDGMLVELDATVGNQNSMGRWWGQQSGVTAPLIANEADGCITAWGYPLSTDRSRSATIRGGYSTGATNLWDTQKNFDIIDTEDWTPVYTHGDASATGTGRAIFTIYSSESSANIDLGRQLLFIAGIANSYHWPYIAARYNTTVPPDELLVLTPTPSATWTAGGLFWRPVFSSHANNFDLLTVTGGEVSETTITATLVPGTWTSVSSMLVDKIRFSGSVAGTPITPVDVDVFLWYRRHPIEIRLSCDDANEIEYTISGVGGLMSGSITGTSPYTALEVSVTGTNVPAVEIGGLYFSDEFEDEATREARIQSLASWVLPSLNQFTQQQLLIPPAA